MTSNGGLLGGAEATKLVDDIEDGVSVGGELDPGLGLAARATRLTQLKLECSRPNLTLRLKKKIEKVLIECKAKVSRICSLPLRQF